MRSRTRSLTALAGASLLAVPFVPGVAGVAGAQVGPTDFSVTTAVDSVDATPGDGVCADAQGECSLRAAIQEASAAGGSYRVFAGQFPTYELTLDGAGENDGASGDLDVDAVILLLGDGATVDALGADRAFDVSAQGELEVRNLDVVGGAPPSGESGGGYRSAGVLTLVGGSVAGNVAEGSGASGGGVFNDGGTLSVSGTTITGNEATRAGGGIEALDGETSLDRVTLSGNSTGPTPGNGGGFHLTGAGTVEVRRSTVVGNTASAEGGGLWNSAGGTMLVAHSAVSGNTASGDEADEGGGGLFNDGGVLDVVKTSITGNVADGAAGSGGGLFNDGGTMSVTWSAISSNTAVRAGGGVEADVGVTSLDGVVISYNETGDGPGNGGGVHVTGAGTVTVADSAVFRNGAANEGGGLWNSATGVFTVTGSVVGGNRAPAGRDNFNVGGDFTVDGEAVPLG